ncbi:MAG TPA: hypothetical protein VHB77_21125, partial [Planctomycetaceae bacterium]|nr:hypothetical protein [Planctomycetaceae bacterium]
ANEYYRRNTERYRGTDTVWYQWCRRTGRGDLDTAKKLVEPRMEALRGTDAGVFEYPFYCETMGRKEEALKGYAKGLHQYQFPMVGFLGFLLADELKQVEQRDQLLAETTRAASHAAEHFLPMLLAFREVLDHPDEDIITPERAEWYISNKPIWGEPTHGMFILGKFLVLHGHKELGLKYLQRAASSPHDFPNNDTRILAGALLATLDLETPPLAASEFPEESSRGVDCIDRALEQNPNTKPKDPGAVLAEARAKSPKLVAAWIKSAEFASEAKDYRAADTYYQKALELVDNEPSLRAMWGKQHEREGRMREAIADYEAVLKRHPRHSLALHNLAAILATATDDGLREGKRSIELAKAAVQTRQIPDEDAYATLAAAYAESGQFTEAVKWSTKSMEASPEWTHPKKQKVIDLYKQKKPLRQDTKLDDATPTAE